MPRKKVTTAAAGAEVARRKPPSHQPGYPRKDRQGKVALMVQLDGEQRKQLHAAAKAGGFASTQEFVTLVLAEVAKQYLADTQEKPTISKAVAKQRAAVRQAALRLAAALR